MKKTVCVIFGGCSSEHEVSCQSAANILCYIDRERYEVLAVGISKEGSWYLYRGNPEQLRSGAWEEQRGKACTLSLDPQRNGLLVWNRNGDVSFTHVDVFFPALHGKNGEDGTIQGMFEMAGASYVGDGVLASAVCMDKVTTKKLLRESGVPVTDGFDLSAREAADCAAVHAKIMKAFGYPVVVKPSNAGSSVGITKVKGETALSGALRLAAENDRRILVERAIDARELECAVLGGYSGAQASCVGEIVKQTEMYDYETKYITDSAKLAIPAALSEEQSEKIRETALRAFRAVDGFGLARVDFFLDRKTGAIMLNEINTMPGFTNISMYPMLWAHSGVSNGELVTRLIELSAQRGGGGSRG